MQWNVNHFAEDLGGLYEVIPLLLIRYTKPPSNTVRHKKLKNKHNPIMRGYIIHVQETVKRPAQLTSWLLYEEPA